MSDRRTHTEVQTDRSTDRRATDRQKDVDIAFTTSPTLSIQRNCSGYQVRTRFDEQFACSWSFLWSLSWRYSRQTDNRPSMQTSEWHWPHSTLLHW